MMGFWSVDTVVAVRIELALLTLSFEPDKKSQQMKSDLQIYWNFFVFLRCSQSWSDFFVLVKSQK